jgi:hypothetical protein
LIGAVVVAGLVEMFYFLNKIGFVRIRTSASLFFVISCNRANDQTPMASFNDMRAKYQVDWKVPDVHSWSTAMSQTLETEFPNLVGSINALEPKYEMGREKVIKMFPGDGKVLQVMEMFDRRKNVRDSDLVGVSCGGCLCMTYCLIAKLQFEKSMVAAFYDTLMDMGVTCLQGYTHRLMSLIVPMLRCLQEQRKDDDTRTGDCL